MDDSHFGRIPLRGAVAHTPSEMAYLALLRGDEVRIGAGRGVVVSDAV